MKNKILPFIIGLSLTFIFSGAFFIQKNIAKGENIENVGSEVTEGDASEWPGETGDESDSEKEKFSDYYKFGSIKVDIQNERGSYVPGDKIKFSGTVANTNFYPIINGELYVRIFQENETNSRENGDYVIDEFFVLENINLMPSEKKNVYFSWDIPPTAFNGDYKLATFFTVDKKYNLSGLSFTSNVYANFCTFEIKGNNQGRIIFDRNNAEFNNEPYLFRSYIPEITSKDKAEISIPLNNLYNISKDVRITYDLYYWDALLEENKIKSDSEDFVIGSNSYRRVGYYLDDINLSVYLLKITATSGVDKSIVDVRFGVSDIPLARINYAGITKFPIKKGEKAKVFVCFHNTNDSGFNGQINLNLKDENGKIVASKSYQGNITGDVMVKTAEIDSKKDLKLLNLESKLSDESGKVIDSFSKTYDISELNPNYIEKTSSEENKTGIYLGALLLIIILIIIYFIHKRKPKPIFVFVFLLVGMGLVFCLTENRKEVEVVRADNLSNSTNQVLNYNLQFPGSGTRGGIDQTAKSFNFDLNINYDLFLLQKSRSGRLGILSRFLKRDRFLKNGDNVCGEVVFEFDKNGEWFDIGGNWDTPPVYWENDFNFSGKECRNVDYFKQQIYSSKRGSISYSAYAPLIIKNPSYKVEAISGPVTCEGNSCFILGNGEVVIKATVDATEFTQRIYHKRSGECVRENASCGCYSAIQFRDSHENCSGCYNCCKRNARHQSLPISSATKIWHLSCHNKQEPIDKQEPTAQIQCSTSDCTTFENESFTLLNKSYDDKTPDDKLKSTWIITKVDDPQVFQRTECENKCDYSLQNLPLGEYSAYLRVEDEDGLSDETTKNFRIKKDIEVEFQCSLDNQNWQSCPSTFALTGQKVYFRDVSLPSEGARAKERNWQFEDGNPKEDKGNNPNPLTRFISEGAKEVSLEVEDSVGRIKTVKESVKIFSEENLKFMPDWYEVTPRW